jgi:hypothetical protein
MCEWAKASFEVPFNHLCAPRSEITSTPKKSHLSIELVMAACLSPIGLTMEMHSAHDNVPLLCVCARLKRKMR